MNTTALAVSLEIAKPPNLEHKRIAPGEILIDLLRRAKEIAVSYGAFHSGTLGDTSLFYFDHPKNIDTNRLALRSILDIARIVNQLNLKSNKLYSMEVCFRAGLEFGTLFETNEKHPNGEAAIIAMNLARAANPNQILCTDYNRIKVEHYAYLEESEKKITTTENKGTTCYSITGEKPFEAINFDCNPREETTLSGRKINIENILQILSNTNQRPTPIINLQGETGIGKSYIISEVLLKTPYKIEFVSQCLPYKKDDPLAPIKRTLKRIYLLNEKSPHHASKKIQSILENQKGIELETDIPIICNWLDLPISNRIKPALFSPKKNKNRLFELIFGLIFYKKSTQTKAVLVIENIHFADPTTIEFIRFVKDNSNHRNILIFTSTSHHSPFSESKSFAIERLTENESLTLAKNLLDKKKTSENIEKEILSRTKGNPLLIHELTFLLNNIEPEDSEFYIRKKNGNNAPHVKINILLQLKFDLLTRAKKTGQLASAIGNEFTLSEISKLSQLDNEILDSHLTELVRFKFLELQRETLNIKYIFRNTETHKFIYNSMSEREKHDTHNKILNFHIGSNFENENPIDFIYHSIRTGRYFQAIDIGLKIIKYRTNMSMNIEAVELAHKINTWITTIKNETTRFELGLQVKYLILPAISSLKGLESQDAKKLLDESEILFESIKVKKNSALEKCYNFLHKIQWCFFVYHHSRQNVIKARLISKKMLMYSKESKDSYGESMVSAFLAQSYFIEGDFFTARKLFNQLIKTRTAESEKSRFSEYGIDLLTFSFGNMCIIELCLGHPDTAILYADKSIMFALRTKHSQSILHAFTFKALLSNLLGDKELALSAIEGYYNLADNRGSENLQIGHLHQIEDWVKGNWKRSQKFADHCLQIEQSQVLSWYIPGLSETLIKCNKLDEAEDLLNTLCQKTRNRQELSALPILLNQLALVKIKIKGMTEQSQTILIEAIELARLQNSCWLELEAAITLCEHSEVNEQKSIYKEFCLPLIERLNQGEQWPLFTRANRLYNKLVA